METVRHATAGAVCELLAARVEAERGTLPAGVEQGVGARVVSELDEAIKSSVRALRLAKALTDPDPARSLAIDDATVIQFPTVRRAQAA